MNLVVSSGAGTTGADVALTKLVVPDRITVNGSRSLEIDAYATTTAKEVDATVTLAASPGSGITVKLDHASVREEVKSNEQNKFEFGAKVTCNRRGTWPVAWTAKISAAQNSNSANDTLKGTTQVTCSGQSREDDVKPGH